jgi:hypothetical protein
MQTVLNNLIEEVRSLKASSQPSSQQSQQLQLSQESQGLSQRSRGLSVSPKPVGGYLRLTCQVLKEMNEEQYKIFRVLWITRCTTTFNLYIVT